MLDITTADDEAAGAGVGVKYDVIRTVSAGWEAIGFPSGFRNVIGGFTRVMTVFWIGSMTSAVSALTRCPVEDDSPRLEVCCKVSLAMLVVIDAVVADASNTEVEVCATVDVVLEKLAKLKIVSMGYVMRIWVRPTAAVCCAEVPVPRL
jgi:hypothetical protein